MHPSFQDARLLLDCDSAVCAENSNILFNKNNLNTAATLATMHIITNNDIMCDTFQCFSSYGVMGYKDVRLS